MEDTSSPEKYSEKFEFSQEDSSPFLTCDMFCDPFYRWNAVFIKLEAKVGGTEGWQALLL